MATLYPTSLDALTNPTATDSTTTVSHADQHANANDAIEALQAKVGIDSSAVTSSLDYRVATLESATDTDVWGGITGTLSNQTDLQSALDAKQDTLTGLTSSVAELNILDGVTATTTELNFIDGVTGALQTQLDLKAPLASPTFTGTVAGITKNMVGLGNVDNTTDAGKPVSTATQTALDLKANDADVVHDAGDETIAGVKTFSSDPIIPDEAYGVGWDGSLEPATKNAVYDKIETLNSAEWGNITGTLSSQTDLQTALDGKQATITGLTASGAELNILDGATLTVTELNFVDGVTSAIQTQLDSKSASSHAHAINDLSDVTITAIADNHILKYDSGTSQWVNEADAGGGSWGSITGTLADQTDLNNALGAKVNDTGDETIAGVKTFSSDPLIPDEVYGVGWNGSLEPPTKNAVYDKISTMPDVNTSLVHGEVPSGTVNGSNTAFTLSATPATGSLNLFQNGVRLKITEDYTLSTATITFVTAPATGDLLLADYFTTASVVAQGSTSFVYDETPTGTVNSSNTVFTIANTPVAGTLQLFRDGQLLVGGGADYSLSGTTVTFVTAPTTGSVLKAFYQKSLTVAGNADTIDGFHASDTPTSGSLHPWYGGWVKPNVTWTYASASTFTVSGDATTIYTKGTRLKWTQTTVKYGVVVSSSHSAGTTTVTIAVNTDYTIANATITDNFFSYEANPQGYPTWFNCASPSFVVSLFDNGAGGQPTTAKCRMSILGSTCHAYWDGSGVKAGGGSEIKFNITNVFPQPSNFTVLGVLGSAYSHTNVPAVITYVSATEWRMITSASIADNAVIGYISVNAVYEI